jgi:hypothetical protein
MLSKSLRQIVHYIIMGKRLLTEQFYCKGASSPLSEANPILPLCSNKKPEMRQMAEAGCGDKNLWNSLA